MYTITALHDNTATVTTTTAHTPADAVSRAIILVDDTSTIELCNNEIYLHGLDNSVRITRANETPLKEYEKEIFLNLLKNT